MHRLISVADPFLLSIEFAGHALPKPIGFL